MSIDLCDVRKALFTSPAVNTNEIDKSDRTVGSKAHIDYETDLALRNAQKDCHDQVMKKFRQTAKRLQEDDWLYTPIEKLIGFK